MELQRNWSINSESKPAEIAWHANCHKWFCGHLPLRLIEPQATRLGLFQNPACQGDTSVFREFEGIAM